MQLKVLHLEDSETQRIVAQSEMELRGFVVRSPETIAEAKALLKSEGDTFDVMILDMNLNEYEDCQGETGGRLAIEFLQANQGLPRPEFLILSAYHTSEALTSALQLGVASYLSKSEANMESLISHVRVLALRHALSNGRSELSKEADSISLTSIDELDALLKFSKKHLIPAMSAYLGLPFFLLLTKQNPAEINRATDTLYIGGSVGWPVSSSYYEILQGYAYGNANDPQPVQVFEGLLPAPTDSSDRDLLKRFEHGALIPIALSDDLLLSIFLAKADQANPLEESPAELGPIIIQYFRSFILSTLLELLIKVRERSVRQRTILTETARFCLLLGQEQRESLKEMEGLDADKSLRFNKNLTRLKFMAEELYRTGALLKELTESSQPILHESVTLLEVIREVWSELERLHITDAINLKLPAADCSLKMAPDDLWLLLTTLLQWFGQRRIATPEHVLKEVKVDWQQDDSLLELVFEDSSARLFSPLRARLFEPWMITPSDSGETDIHRKPETSFAMYLAKAIVEFKYGGQLVDCSDEIEGDLGHRFVIRLPIAQDAARIRAVTSGAGSS